MMSMKEIIAVMFACILANNYVFQNFLGVESVEADSRKSLNSIVAMGLSVTVVLLVTTLLVAPLQGLLTTSAQYLATMVYAVVATLVVYALNFVAKKVSKDHACSTLPIVVNSIVLGACLMNSASGYGLVASLFASVGIGLGYLLASLVVAGVRERVNEKFVPSSWKGAPILCAEMAIIALVLFAF
ncbi:MAG: hypothetical protein KBS81_03980 [Spirochaetales bacterium]|nr:hypothetical protein [Candidatus Physcosoma equi]